MAFINADGKSVSVECSELINELKEDIAEFGGDKIVAVWCKEYEGVIIYTNYDFIDDKEPIMEYDFNNGELFKTMTMNSLLKALEKQNSLF